MRCELERPCVRVIVSAYRKAPLKGARRVTDVDQGRELHVALEKAVVPWAEGDGQPHWVWVVQVRAFPLASEAFHGCRPEGGG